MRHPHALMVRYTGSDAHRRFLLQRRDGSFWTGKTFSPREQDAELYADKHLAQRTRHVLMAEAYRGKAERTFRCELTFTMTGDAISGITLRELSEYLFQAVAVNADNGACGDGPREGVWVLPVIRLGTLRETPRSPEQVRRRRSTE